MAKFTRRDAKVGLKVRMLNSKYMSYSLNQGDVVEVCAVGNGNTLNVQAPSYGVVSVNLIDIEIAIQTKQELQEKIAVLKTEIKSEEAKLKWMEDTGVAVYDGDEFKVWSVLQTLGSRATQMQKTKAIVALIKG